MKNAYKRLQLSERIDIEKMLALGISLTEIALTLNRNKSTISREIRKELSVYRNSHTGTLQYTFRHVGTGYQWNRDI